MSLSSLNLIGQPVFELESRNKNVDGQMDGQTNGHILFQRYYSFLNILSDFTNKTNRLILIMLLDSVCCVTLSQLFILYQRLYSYYLILTDQCATPLVILSNSHLSLGVFLWKCLHLNDYSLLLENISHYKLML